LIFDEGETILNIRTSFNRDQRMFVQISFDEFASNLTL